MPIGRRRLRTPRQTLRLQCLEGFKGALFLTDPDTGKYVSMTLWETEADMEAGEASGYLREQVAKAVPALAAPPIREHYEVHVKTWSHVPGRQCLLR